MSDRMVPLKKQAGYAQAYDYLLDSDLTGEELRIYLMLMRYGDSSNYRIPLQATLAKRRGVTTQAISNLIRKLVEKGWLRVDTIDVPAEKRSNAFATRRNCYTLLVPAVETDDVSVIDDEDVVIVDEPEPKPKPKAKPKSDKPEDYILRGGQLAGQPITVLLEKPEHLPWYREECYLDREKVNAWLDTLRRPKHELNRVVNIIMSPHIDVTGKTKLERCHRDLLDYAKRNNLSKNDVIYIEDQIRRLIKE